MTRLTSLGLVRGNLARRPLRTGMLAAIVALFCLTLYCGTLVGQKAGIAASVVSERLGADFLFVPYGYEKKIQGSLLRGEPSSFYMDRALEGELRKEEGVAKVTSQLFMATFKASCCSLPVQLIGFDPATDFVVHPWLSSVLDRPLAENEVVVGRKIQSEVGQSVKLLGKDFVIAARLDETGMGFDTSIFLELDRARRLLLLSELGPLLAIPEGLDRNTFVSSVLVKAQPGVDTTKLVNSLLEKYAIRYNLDFVAVAEMITDIGARLLVFARIFRAFAVLLWVLAVAVLALVFSSAVEERRKEFGVLRTIGATKWALTRIVLVEAFLVSTMGAFAGVLVAGVLMALFDTFIDVTLQLPGAGLGVADLLRTGACVLVPGLLAGPLACLPAIRRLANVDAYLAMREEA